jgi:hypothetical protein
MTADDEQTAYVIVTKAETYRLWHPGQQKRAHSRRRQPPPPCFRGAGGIVAGLSTRCRDGAVYRHGPRNAFVPEELDFYPALLILTVSGCRRRS